MIIKAPKGLLGIEEHMAKCELPLEPWESGYNSKIILRQKPGTDIGWSMETSDDDELHASGEIHNDAEIAISKIKTLSEVLKEMKLPHQILVDDDNGMLAIEIEYEWVDKQRT